MAYSGFISYAHADRRMCRELRKHLKSVEVDGMAAFWVDEHIRVGDRWDPAIRGALLAADIIVMAMSADFIWSDYIRNHEMPLIEQRQGEGAIVVPVILKPCLWQHLYPGYFQAAPCDGRAIQEHNPRARGYADATTLIRQCLLTHAKGARHA